MDGQTAAHPKITPQVPFPSRRLGPSRYPQPASGPLRPPSGPPAQQRPPEEKPLASRGHLKKNRSATPLTEEEIKLALSKSSPSSAPGQHGIPYSLCKRVNFINPAILLQLLSPLVPFGYHPPSLKTTNGVAMNKPGKAS